MSNYGWKPNIQSTFFGFMTCYGKPLPLHEIALVFFFTRHAVAQLVKALRFKPEGRGFDSWWCHWHYGLEGDSASNRNECQEYILGAKGGRWVGLTTDHHEIWEPRLPGTLKACPDLYKNCFTLCIKLITNNNIIINNITLLQIVQCVWNVCSFHFTCATIVTRVSVFPMHAA